MAQSNQFSRRKRLIGFFNLRKNKLWFRDRLDSFVTLIVQSFLGRTGIRFCKMNGKGRITQMIVPLETELRRLKALRRNDYIIVINPGKDANPFLTSMYRRHLTILDRGTPVLLFIANRLLRLLTLLESKIVAADFGTQQLASSGVFETQSPGLSFTAHEEREGKELLERIGIPLSAKYICVGLREDDYYQMFRGPGAGSDELNREVKEDCAIRNPSLSVYLLVMKHLADKGFYVLRMGQITGKEVPEGFHPRVIDYSKKFRTEFGDIYLLAHCHFTLAAAAGLWAISESFNIPCILSDHYNPSCRQYRSTDLVLPRRLWSLKEKRFISMKEQIKSELKYTFDGNCQKDQIQLIPCTSQEIIEICDEMIARTEERWTESKEVKELKTKIETYFDFHHFGYRQPSQFGTQYLLKNRDLGI